MGFCNNPRHLKLWQAIKITIREGYLIASSSSKPTCLFCLWTHPGVILTPWTHSHRLVSQQFSTTMPVPGPGLWKKSYQKYSLFIHHGPVTSELKNAVSCDKGISILSPLAVTVAPFFFAPSELSNIKHYLTSCGYCDYYTTIRNCGVSQVILK